MDKHQITRIRIIIILIALMLTWLLNSCMTYNKAKARYAKTKYDTITVTKQVTAIVNKDSVRYNFIADTIPFYKEIRQGRASIKIEYRDKIVKLKADCDSATKTEYVTLKAPQEINTWGVTPFYERGFFVLCGLFAFAVLHIIIMHKKPK